MIAIVTVKNGSLI